MISKYRYRMIRKGKTGESWKIMDTYKGKVVMSFKTKPEAFVIERTLNALTLTAKAHDAQLMMIENVEKVVSSFANMPLEDVKKLR